MTDKEHWHAMKALGVTWPRKSALPTYRSSMTLAQKIEADAHYDAMSDTFVNSFGRMGPND